MRITCMLRNREIPSKIVTEIDVPFSSSFGINSENPFPASHYHTAVVFSDHVIINYRIDPAPEGD